MILKAEGLFDANDKYLHHSRVAELAIKNAFQYLQQARGNWNSIRVTRKFIECTTEGDIVNYTNRGETVKVIEGPYNTTIELNGVMEDYSKEIQYWRP